MAVPEGRATRYVGMRDLPAEVLGRTWYLRVLQLGVVRPGVDTRTGSIGGSRGNLVPLTENDSSTLGSESSVKPFTRLRSRVE